MSRQLLLSRLLDNHARGSVGEFLRDRTRAGSDLSVVSAFFTIYAYHALRTPLDGIASMRFLFGEPNFIKTIDPNKERRLSAHIEHDELQLEQQLQQSRIAKACADWISSRVEVRSVRKPGFVHGKLYHIQQGDYEKAVLGSSNFTVQGLGLGKRPNIELNLEVTDSRDHEDLKQWFEELWNNTSLVEDVKQQVLEHLERLYAPTAPQFVYYKTLYHLFSEKKADSSVELKQRQRLNESEIWQTLFEFQRHGAEATIRKLLAHRGCILADSVGLGKTYTALAVIKYFENLNDRVLVLTPKKLRENWTVYQAPNNSPLNPFLKDRFAYTVLSHTDLSRDSGMVGDINLQTLNWSNYDLVVIDESHNFRNNTRGKRDQDGQPIRKSRYERLLEDIINSGVPTKVLLLSATPVNTDLSDLRNQLMLMSGGEDHAYADDLGVSRLNSVLGVAQKEFNQWASKEPRQPEVLIERLSASFFSLLDGLTLARSRKHIQTHYAHEMSHLGGFPERQKPLAVYAQVDSHNIFPDYADVHDDIDHYQLALFNPFKYVNPPYRELYDRDGVANFTQANRERYLIGMMKMNFLKRLESSVHSFALTLERTCDKITQLIEKLQIFQDRQQSGDFEVEAETFDDQELQEALQVGKQVKYDLRHLDVERWLKDLWADDDQLRTIFGIARMVTPQRDAKLAELRSLIEAKIKQPTQNKLGEPNRKTLVFTAFADTAKYLYQQLEPWARARGIHIGLVVGTGDNRCTLGQPDFNAILTNFSPRSKRRNQLASFPQDQEIDLLIATDCISEGQNLQDCDYLVNYDIHWNPVRLIQRFGRIDRIGSSNHSIQMVNFWPTDDLNAYLNLKNRVEARMALVDITATAQDNPLTLDQIRADLSYRDQQLVRLKDEVLDLEDLEGGVTLSDFSLDDFRMDLNNFLDAHREQLESAPLGLFGLVNEEGQTAKPGIVFCLRQLGTVADASLNPLIPYFLVYVRSSGEVRFAYAQAKQTLELYRALCAQKNQAQQTLHDHFDRLTGNLENLQKETALLQTALDSIRQTFQRKAAQTLFGGRGATIPKLEEQVTEETPFELVTWLVILENQNHMV